jgi:hypothetical protein
MQRSHNHACTQARTSAATARRRRHVEWLTVLNVIAPKKSRCRASAAVQRRAFKGCARGPRPLPLLGHVSRS